jgi:hypothetical protein
MQSRAMLRTAHAYLDHITHERARDAPAVVGEPRRGIGPRFRAGPSLPDMPPCHPTSAWWGDEFREGGTRALCERHEAGRDHEIIGRQRIWK